MLFGVDPRICAPPIDDALGVALPLRAPSLCMSGDMAPRLCVVAFVALRAHEHVLLGEGAAIRGPIPGGAGRCI